MKEKKNMLGENELEQVSGGTGEETEETENSAQDQPSSSGGHVYPVDIPLYWP